MVALTYSHMQTACLAGAAKADENPTLLGGILMTLISEAPHEKAQTDQFRLRLITSGGSLLKTASRRPSHR